MPATFITATGTDVGKTFVACALIRALVAEGRAVDALKPVLSGYDGLAGSDAGLLLEALGAPESGLDRISPLRFIAPVAPPSAARFEGETLELETLVSLCRARMNEDPDTVLLIEGAGGVMSPIAEGATNLDLIAELAVPAILVTGTYLGSVSHALTALEVLGGRNIPVRAVVVSATSDDPLMIGEITRALETFAPGHRLILAPRDGAWAGGTLAAMV